MQEALRLPRDALHHTAPVPQSLGTFGAQEEGVGWEQGGRNNEGKTGRGCQRKSPCPFSRWSFCLCL